MTKFRKMLASKLVRLARRLDPDSKEAMQFYMDKVVQAALIGGSIKVEYVPPEKMYASPSIK